MSGEPNLDDLLEIWQTAYETGRDIPVSELCRDCPEMAAEVERRLQVLRRGARLVGWSDHAVTADLTGSQHSDTVPLPPRLGGYRLLSKLGSGGMGEVYRAEEAALGREVAIKVMRKELAALPGYRERFLREARTAAMVRHDNVVPIYLVGEENGTLYIVMPMLEGESLENRLTRTGALPVQEAVRVGREAAEGLAAAHSKGLVHRDIKPANLWLEAPTGRVKILDFGLARVVNTDDQLSTPGTVFGTPAYMAPEQANGDTVDHRADLFALGTVLYRCLTGGPAFNGKSLTAILWAVAEVNPPPPQEVNPAIPLPLSELVMRMLGKNPVDRPATALQVAQELQRLDTGDSAGAPTARWLSPGEQGVVNRRRRNRIKWSAALACCALVVVGLAYWSRLVPPTTDPEPNPTPQPPNGQPVTTVQYKGRVDVKLARTKEEPLQRLNVFGTLPMRQADTFRIEAEIDPPAYVYMVWVDPPKEGIQPDVTAVFPWDATAEDPWATRPLQEEPISRLSLPRAVEKRWTAPSAKPGVATIVLFARPTPLDVPDTEVRRWFESLPELPLPPVGDTGVVWFDNYVETKDTTRLRAGFTEIVSGDHFARWQAQLQKSLQPHAAFQTAVSFARVGKK
jgi:serine/threonine protein kinase